MGNSILRDIHTITAFQDGSNGIYYLGVGVGVGLGGASLLAIIVIVTVFQCKKHRDLRFVPFNPSFVTLGHR